MTFSIRPATEQDNGTIKGMIRSARLDPTSLQWQHFLIAEMDDKIVGIGQIKHYPGCQELGSLVVLPAYQKQGIGGRLITELETRARSPLYLLCESSMEAYYQRFGYIQASWWAIPPFLKLKMLLSVLLRLFGIRIIVMRKDAKYTLNELVSQGTDENIHTEINTDPPLGKEAW